jgi:predicted nucleic acid-binding protein
VLYLDTSALIKRYVLETGTESIEQRLQDEENAARPPVTSVLTFAEVHAALMQRRNDRSLSNRTFMHCRTRFDTDWAVSFSPIDLGPGVLNIVREVVGLGLKGADAVHLASAIWLSDAVRLGLAPSTKIDTVVFTTSDKKLAKAAVTKGFEVFNPEDQP